MGQALIIEIVDSRGRIQHRVRLGDSPLTIGRSYRNDVILDDPFVEADHLRIDPTEEGTWIVSDLGTRNGTWEGRDGRRVTSQLLQTATELRIGHTTVRAVSPDHPVAPALVDPSHRISGARRLAQPWWALAATVLALTVSTIFQFLGSDSHQGIAELATPGLVILTIAGGWAAAWAFTNRLVAQRFQFLGHLGWALVLGTAFGLTTTIFEWIGFFVPAVEWSWIEVVVDGGLFAILLTGHLQLVTEWSAAKQWRVAGATAAVAIGVGAILTRSNAFNDDGAGGSSSVALKPIDADWVPATSIDQFFRKAGSLQRIVDDLAGDDPPN